MNTAFLINFINLSKEKKLEILSWRNDQSIRIWMYDDSIIKEESHISFIDTLKEDKTKQYFLVSNSDKDLGVIYFTDISKDQVEFGIYSNPNTKKVGKILMETICNYGFNTLKTKKLIAEVFENNIKAISLYNQFNFKQTNKLIRNNKTILSLELENENR